MNSNNKNLKYIGSKLSFSSLKEQFTYDEYVNWIMCEYVC